MPYPPSPGGSNIFQLGMDKTLWYIYTVEYFLARIGNELWDTPGSMDVSQKNYVEGKKLDIYILI